MPKYRGFMKEVSLGDYPSPISSGETIDRFNLGAIGCHNLGAAFSGPRTYSVPSVIQTVAQAAPAPAYVPQIVPILPGIPGDIRDITARTTPGVAIEDTPDDMTAENGVPGVDNGGAFPYGDPRLSKTGAEKPATGNQALFIAAIVALLLLGG